MLNSLLVLAGAVVGLAGGVFATIYAQNRQSKREKYKELRSNLLVVTLEVSKVLAWAEKHATYCASCSAEQFMSASQNPPAQVDPNPAQKIQAIASLYFPEIVDDARALSIAGSQHHIIAHQLFLARFQLHLGKGSQKDVVKEQENVHAAFVNLCARQERFENATQKLMAKLLKEKS